MTDNYLIIIICTIILLIEVYNETFLQNYGTFIERLKYFFSLKMFFKTIKITFFLFFILLIYKYSFGGKLINYDFIRENIFTIKFELLKYYFTPVSFYALWLILTNSRKILVEFSNDEFNYSRANQFLSFSAFILYRLITFILIYILFAITFRYLIILDESFSANKLSLLDWINNSSKNDINYNSGVYLSLVITTFIFFIFNNAFIKINSPFYNFKSSELSFFSYFFVSIILSIGIFFGFFSIFNAYHNIRITSLKEWFSNENILGILPLRIASVVILVNLFGYVYKEILESRIKPFLILALFPVRNIESYNLNLKIEKRETLYFSQISFYILNIAIAEYFVIIEFKNLYVSILNFAILFIQDDFKIINDYSNGLQNVLLKHLRKIYLFNTIMFCSAFIVLLLTNEYEVFSGYVILSVLLALLYGYNYSLVNRHDYIYD
ncbi:hypothetical protein [Epilithonimonas zeae]|uniref:hypothetical protein n=1 Tax=Epilithonimonas zeae TaxID=1416779 RepID=UPI00200FF2A0|nr:hypothetical protein [Epilithonimonas zeae]UQB69453.1 hypothetical protein KI430_03220 [Epilithonimonas zeae]